MINKKLQEIRTMSTSGVIRSYLSTRFKLLTRSQQAINKGFSTRFFSTNGKKDNLVLLPNIEFKDAFISSLKRELSLIIKQKKIVKLDYCLQTSDGTINFWEQVEHKFAWSDNNIFDEDFKDGGYQEDWTQFIKYCIIHSDTSNNIKKYDLDAYIEDIYLKLTGVESSKSTYTILIINKFQVNKTNKQLKGVSILNNKRNFSTSLKKLYDYYSDIKYVIENNPINEETQKNIEAYLLNHGISLSNEDTKINGLYKQLYNRNTNEFFYKYKPAIISKVKRFLSEKENFIKDNTDKSKESIKFIDVIETVGINYVLAIMFGRFLRILSNTKYNFTFERNLAIDVGIDLGGDLVREYFRVKYNNHCKNLIKEGTIKSMHDYTFTDWKKDNIDFFNILTNSNFKLKLGAKALEWLEDVDILARTLVKHDSTQHHVYISNPDLTKEWENKFETVKYYPSKESLKLLEDSKETKKLETYKKLMENVSEDSFSINNNLELKSSSSMTMPLRLPSIIKPKPYIEDKDKVILGGYILNDLVYSDSLILPNYSLDKQSTIHKKNIIYDIINNINSVGYKINVDLFNFLIMNPDLYENSLIDKQHPLLNKVKLTKKERVDLQKHVSKYELQEHILKIANVYLNVPEFFFINRIDNRGRLYCVTEYLNYQSTELAKALLIFSVPNKISRLKSDVSLLYFEAYGVNCYGNKLDKMSLTDKSEWIKNNLNDILNYSNGLLIKKAENKFLFTAFCIEYKKWHNFYYNTEDTYFNTQLPIQLDASCNGFQHLVLLSRESNLLRKQLNLTPSEYNNKPYDFYSYVLEVYKDYLNSLDLSKLSDEERNSYKRIKIFCLDRSIIKKMIMTIPYNATTKKMVDDITEILIRDNIVEGEDKSWFYHPEDIDCPKKMLCYKDLYLLVTSLKNQLDKIAPRVTKLKKYLEKIAEICTQLELHIPWLLPTGLEVKQSYLKSTSENIKPFTYSNSKIKLSIYTNKLDKAKQIRAFMPNLIHSLDATSLMLLLDKYFKNHEFEVKNIYTIHDCFAMPMNHIEFIIDFLRKVYISLYSDSGYLKELDKFILDSIINQYGENSYDKKTRTFKIEINGVVKVFCFPNIKEVLGENLPLHGPIPSLLI